MYLKNQTSHDKSYFSFRSGFCYLNHINYLFISFLTHSCLGGHHSVVTHNKHAHYKKIMPIDLNRLISDFKLQPFISYQPDNHHLFQSRAALAVSTTSGTPRANPVFPVSTRTNKDRSLASHVRTISPE